MHELKDDPIYAEAVRMGSHNGNPFQWGVERRLSKGKRLKVPAVVLVAAAAFFVLFVATAAGR